MNQEQTARTTATTLVCKCFAMATASDGNTMPLTLREHLIDAVAELARRASSAEKALREIADAGREDGEGIEEATGGRNFDDAYWEGCNHGAFVAGEIARAVLEEKR